MPTATRSIVFPVETIARELDGKLLLALCARERGWDVRIGNMAEHRSLMRGLSRAVYFAKSARSMNARRFAELRQLGHEVVVLDEEGLVRQTDDIYLMKHERNALRDVSLVLTWGEDSAELWRRSGLLGGIDADPAGNPRIDMLRRELRPFHAEEVADLRARFGDYVLFNSNFGTVNNVVSESTRFNLATWVPPEEAEREARGLLTHKRAIFERFLTLLPKVAAAIAPRQLVIRPHPAESHAPWHELAVGHPNVTVIFEGSVVPWIAGARLLIHNGCTSAVEAAVYGTPVLTYRPVTSDHYDNPLPNAVGTECFDDAELLAALSAGLEAGPAPLTGAQQALLDRHISLGHRGLCCDMIMDAVERHGLGAGQAKRAPLGVRLGLAARDRRRQVREWLRGFSAKGAARAAYRAHKFPSLTPAIADARVARFQAAVSRFEGMRTREIARNVLEMIG